MFKTQEEDKTKFISLNLHVLPKSDKSGVLVLSDFGALDLEAAAKIS